MKYIEVSCANLEGHTRGLVSADKSLKAKEISTFRLARQLKRDIEPRNITLVFHLDAIGHLRD